MAGVDISDVALLRVSVSCKRLWCHFLGEFWGALSHKSGKIWQGSSAVGMNTVAIALRKVCRHLSSCCNYSPVTRLKAIDVTNR
jgi:hypothetical protein